MRRKIRRLKQCEQTTCGFTCIDTEKVCRINKSIPIRLKTTKLKQLLTRSKQLSNKLDPRRNLSKLKEFEDIVKQLSPKAQSRLLNSADSYHILKTLLAQEAKYSDKRQYITQEEKDAILQWWASGQKNKKNYDVPEQDVEVLWRELGLYDRTIKQQLSVKGNTKYRFETTMLPEERGQFILSLYLRSGGTCAITGRTHNWKNLEPDHKNPELGDVADNLFLIYAPINKNKGKKTWEQYVKSLAKYDPEKKRIEAQKRAANKANMFVEYIDRVRSRTLDLSSPTVPTEFDNSSRLKALTKILSTSPTGKYAIVTQPNKRTNTGSNNTAYQLLRYRLGYIKFREIPESVWEELGLYSSKSRAELENQVKTTFNPRISKTRINPKFEP